MDIHFQYHTRDPSRKGETATTRTASPSPERFQNLDCKRFFDFRRPWHGLDDELRSAGLITPWLTRRDLYVQMARSIMRSGYVAKTRAAWLRRCRHGLAAAVGCAFMLTGAPARAQTADPRETQSRSECLAGRFQAGVDLLAQMFAETGDANYIYNQGRCYEQNGKFSEAILRFREFLRKAKDLSEQERAEVNGHIAECKAMKAEQESPAMSGAAAPVTPPPPAATPSAEVQPAPPAAITPAPTAMTAVPIPAGVVETAPGRPSADSRGASLRTAGIVIGSVGAAGLITGVIFSIETHSISNDVTSDVAKRSFSRTTYDRGQLFGDLQWVGYGVGAAALACGVVLYYLGYRTAQSPASDSVSLLPVLLPGGTGAVVQGSF